MTEFVTNRVKAYSYPMKDGSDYKKSQRNRKSVRKRELVFENYKDCLFNEKIILKY